MFSKWFLNLPWNIFDTIINMAELLVMCIPACFIFIYYKIHSLSIWTSDISDEGATLLLHNASNKRVFITNIKIKSYKSEHFDRINIIWESNVVQIKPDDYKEVIINYTKRSQSRQSFKITIEYNKRKKTVKVKV